MALIAPIALLGCIGAVGAVALNRVAKKFYVYEDPRIADVESFLPSANCGACGQKGCHDFAVKCVCNGSLTGLYCPGAGDEGMGKIAAYLGLTAEKGDTKIAIVKCAGIPATKTPLDAKYRGPRNCAIMNLTVGDYACLQSCLGCGDCVNACPWDAIHIPEGETLPVVDQTKCTGCSQCAQACPRNIIEMRPTGLKGRRVWVACSNCQKGGVTRKQCTVGCIGCGLCVKACPFEAITVTNNLAHIDPAKCKTCGKCIPVGPTHAIQYANMKVAPQPPKGGASESNKPGEKPEV